MSHTSGKLYEDRLRKMREDSKVSINLLLIDALRTLGRDDVTCALQWALVDYGAQGMKSLAGERESIYMSIKTESDKLKSLVDGKPHELKAEARPP
eukprot:3950311-Amphidinium_carterae.2